ncbi:MAG: CoA pyrophosphatase [Planctomycetes bacterium]|nr:CoA pyrophosphatase [Planctomycetota bacterium]
MSRLDAPIGDDVLRKALDGIRDDWDRRPGLRDAAVLVPWFTAADGDRILFTRRRDDLPTHPGQISFPGGARDSGETPVQTALREAREEIGLDPALVEVLGALPVRLSSSGFRVHAIVGRIPPDARLTADPREVAALVPFRVRELRDPARWREAPPPTDAARRPMWRFEANGEVLWGLTAILTRELLGRLEDALRCAD